MNRLILTLLVVTLVGCNGNGGPQRYRYSGAITLEGTSIPFGEIIFTPDASKNNSGPQGKAPIMDGRYDTSFSGGLGVGSGPMTIRINGMSGPGGKTLCEYEMTLEIPKGGGQQDISVPKKDAHNANPKGAGPGAKAKQTPDI